MEETAEVHCPEVEGHGAPNPRASHTAWALQGRLYPARVDPELSGASPLLGQRGEARSVFVQGQQPSDGFAALAQR